IREILLSTGDIGEGCRRLVARANEHGGEDNITAVLVRIDDGPAPNEVSTVPPADDGETTIRGVPRSEGGLARMPADAGSGAATAPPPSPPPSLDAERTLPGIAPPVAPDSRPGDKSR